MTDLADLLADIPDAVCDRCGAAGVALEVVGCDGDVVCAACRVPAQPAFREAAVVLVDVDGTPTPVYWHLPHGRTAVEIPDDVALWDVLWQNRARLVGVAHTHPGSGTPAPSGTDLTTFAAIERALGRTLTWWIVNETDAGVVTAVMRIGFTFTAVPAQPWMDELRRRSYEG